MRTGRPKELLVLTDEERTKLTTLARRHTTAQRMALRAQIVLRCAEGGSNKEVAADLRVHPNTVGKWRGRFLIQRLDGLFDEPRPGVPRTVLDEKVEEVVATTLQPKPKGATHWSTRTLAAEAGLSKSTVQRIWHALGLEPHRHKTFKLSTDPLFVEKVRDIVGLYLDTHAIMDNYGTHKTPQVQRWLSRNTSPR